MLAINTETNKIYVGTVLITSDSDVVVIDEATNSITTVALGYSVAAIVVDPVTTRFLRSQRQLLTGLAGLTVIDGLTQLYDEHRDGHVHFIRRRRREPGDGHDLRDQFGAEQRGGD